MPIPGQVRGPSARAYLLIVLGEYAFDHGDAAWTHTIVDALALAGFEEKAARQALSRTAAAGLLTPQRTGRRTRWHITPAGRESLAAAKDRLFATGPESDWNGDWLILLTTVPEQHRNLRHRLRTTLGWAGFGSLGPGVWISPHPTHAAEARQVLDSLGEPVHGTLLHARLDDPGERHRLVTQAWDVADLDRQYRAFLDRFTPARPRTPGEALAQLAHLVYQWRRLLLADPGLPPTLLPPRWSGEQARRLLLTRHTRWLAHARTWWQAKETEHGRLGIMVN
ncbi:MAG TPA: PaaX family transcriptional regulator C-terminal domain-containing protein [Actinophytocola sp.]|uniref:PaaX family transcriptional regulator n=1 Tax=Actinophytocola sp. TaxID=1872138 RepID=UPI002DDD6075|nr:PaaX family transcriptional regulator C-terminal domain-containing protein [Actinophytocola sp.]HEV2778707.1 PaaX family transcriptional regulator C-terminal domain-containing protein [Actinophytocola sp.]